MIQGSSDVLGSTGPGKEMMMEFRICTMGVNLNIEQSLGVDCFY